MRQKNVWVEFLDKRIVQGFIFSSIGPRLLRIGKPLFLSWKLSLLICLGVQMENVIEVPTLY
jgi:hypothetical protein